MSKIHFITYGSDRRWIYALDRIEREARECGVFDSVTRYTPAMLDRDFAARYAPVLERAIGGGFWIWKHQIIRQKLDEVGDGDAVVYADAGCRLNHKNTAQLFQLINKLNRTPPLANYGMLSVFQGDFGDERMTNQMISYFKNEYGIDDGYKTEYNIGAGALIFLKNAHAYKILDGYKRLLQTDMLLITDAYNHLPQHPNFSGDNRHDQVIFSLLAHVFGGVRSVSQRRFDKNDFFQETRMKKQASVYGLFRVHGALAPLYLADYLGGATIHVLLLTVANFQRHRLRAPLRLVKSYRGHRRKERRELRPLFRIHTSYSVTRSLRGAFLKIKRGGG